MPEAEAAKETPANGADKPLGASQDSWSSAWEAAEKKVAELEAKVAKEPGDDKPKPFDNKPGRDEKGKFVKAEAKQEEPEPEPDEEKEPPPAAKDESEDDADKRAQLHAIAKELGLKVDDRGVSKRERAEFREFKRETRQALSQREQQLQQHEAHLRQLAAPLTTAIKAVQEGDYDAAMRELGRLVKDEELEREGLNGATKKYLRRAQGEDPRVDQLLREQREYQRREAERQREEAERHAHAQQEAQQAQYLNGLSHELSQAGDERVKVLAASPAFVRQVFAVQQREWDGAETCTAEDAAVEVLDGLRKTYDLLDSVFGGRDTLNPEDSDRSGVLSEAQRPKRRAPRPLKKGEAAEASRPAPVTTDPLKWRDKWAKELERST